MVEYLFEMCGRYSLAVILAILAERFGFYNVEEAVIMNLMPRYNLAPSQFAPVVRADSSGKVLEAMRWGLIPGWAKDEKFSAKTINARDDTLAEKPSFKHLIDRSRVLIPADGFFEWTTTPDGRTGPIRILLKTGEPFAFAGLCDTWQKSRDEQVKTFTIITTGANELIEKLHDRMPVILPRDVEDQWLDYSLSRDRVLSLLKPYPSSEMEYYPVSTVVNSARNDSPECLVPIGDPTTQ